MFLDIDILLSRAITTPAREYIPSGSQSSSRATPPCEGGESYDTIYLHIKHQFEIKTILNMMKNL